VPRTTTTTTGVSRRHGPLVEELGFASRFVSGQLQPQPAAAAVPPRPHGELGEAPVERIVDLATQCWDGDAITLRRRGRATRAALSYLSAFAGDTWQHRWDQSPLGRGEIGCHDLEAAHPAGSSVSTGFRSLCCLRAVQPSLLAFRRSRFLAYAPYFIQAQHDRCWTPSPSTSRPTRCRFSIAEPRCWTSPACSRCKASRWPTSPRRHCWPSRTRPGLCGRCCCRAGRSPTSSSASWHGTCSTRWGTSRPQRRPPCGRRCTAGSSASRSWSTATRSPTRPCGGCSSITSTGRAADTDCASLKALVLALAHHYWEQVEALNPGQADLRIAPEVYSAWRQTISVRSDGKPRANRDDIVIAVRSFYYDLHTWAADEPQRWGRWVAPCPVPPAELRGLGKRRRRTNERSADRTRQRQPLLPVLVRYVEDRYDHARALLERARQAAIDETFVLAGRTYRRIVTPAVAHKHRNRAHEIPARVLEVATGKVVRVEHDEDTAFWDWACIETLRHSGVRIEELCELTHLSVRQYQRSNGEVIALLVIAPSKTDRERVIPMSAELFHVIASVIRRHTREGTTIPLLSRFDPHDKVWSAPMPFLFQRRPAEPAAR